MNPRIDNRYGTIIEHQVSGFNLDNVAKELSIQKEFIVKAILLEAKGLDPILCIIRSNDRLNGKIIKKIYAKNYFFMKEEHLSNLNLSPGAIPPFIGFQLKIKTFVDAHLSEEDFYYGSGGSVFNACKFRIQDYIELGAIILKLTMD